jgi:phosphoketolase
VVKETTMSASKSAVSDLRAFGIGRWASFCQDHNGFTHQDPGFLDVVVNKRAEVTRIYLPPDVNSLLGIDRPDVVGWRWPF